MVQTSLAGLVAPLFARYSATRVGFAEAARPSELVGWRAMKERRKLCMSAIETAVFPADPPAGAARETSVRERSGLKRYGLVISALSTLPARYHPLLHLAGDPRVQSIYMVNDFLSRK